MEIENLIKLIETVSASELTGLKYEENGMKLHLTKKEGRVQVVAAPGVNVGNTIDQAMVSGSHTLAGNLSAVNSAAANPPASALENAPTADNAADAAVAGISGRMAEGKIVESPLVGTFYAAPSEDAAPFVAVGDTVRKGQTLAIIEAMKLMNEIESEYDGTVAEILAKNGKPVEYGQPLFRIC
ncbi:MAG: acetyl-CoA carboxylase biotin carboxyl carrier protein [Dorea sp.]|nr:acetyl-CoA carboxylase biotin carboxyl carrier protein [Dorea sp.]MCI9453438.1 acetyl-CoA carboxylase biotin carboxyl carrier protein [Dorea sp.]